MKNLLSLLILCGLTLGSCKKESIEVENLDSEKIEMIDIYGIKYNKDSILNEMAIVLGFESSEIYFDLNTQKFKVKSLDFGEFEPKDYLFLKE